jgi:hypothetical protein
MALHGYSRGGAGSRSRSWGILKIGGRRSGYGYSKAFYAALQHFMLRSKEEGL